MQGALAALGRLFPGGRPAAPEPAELENPALPSIVGLFINFAADSASLFSRGDQQVISDQSDPFRFGAVQENLVATVDMVTVTTWGEVFVHHFGGRRALIRAVGHFMEAVAHPALPAPPTVAAFSFSAAQGVIISRRVEELFNAVSGRFSGRRGDQTPGYILGLERGHALLRLAGDGLSSRYLEGMTPLLAALSEPHSRHLRWVVDPQALTQTPLPLILHGVKAGVVQLYLHPAQRRLYLLDERGTLLSHRLGEGEPPDHYRRFLVDALRRLFLWRPLAHGDLDGDSLKWSGSDGRPFTGELECYILRSGRNGGFSAKGLEGAPPPDDRALNVVVQEGESGRLYTVYCGEVMVAGATLDEALGALLAALGPTAAAGRPWRESVDAPPTLLGAESADALQSVHYLQFKIAVDRRLTELSLS